MEQTTIDDKGAKVIRRIRLVKDPHGLDVRVEEIIDEKGERTIKKIKIDEFGREVI